MPGFSVEGGSLNGEKEFPVRKLVVAGLAAIAAGVLTATAVAASADPPPAGLAPVPSFGANPGNLAMYTYTPPGLAAGRPVVVALHGCTQSAADYYAHSGWPELADRWQFEVVFPQTSSANNALSCFTWFDPADDTRGNGEAASVKSMVDKAVADHGSDRSRVYVTGLSAGGGMTADLLAAYPEVFAGGGIDAGLPAQCAASVTQATSCQQADQHLSPAQWAGRVTAQNPGYTGPWPRVAIWQGTGDYTVYPVNGTELRDQWTAVHGLSPTPTSTRSLPGGTTLTSYGDAVQLYSVAGMGHGTAVDPGAGATQCGSTGAYFLAGICSSYYTAVFWGLDQGAGGSTTPSPTATPVPGVCVTASNYAHTLAGRAHQVAGEVYANGSGQDLGLWNVFVTHALLETSPGYWVLADGQC